MKYTVGRNKMGASCKPCTGKKCWRSCKAPVIDSIAAAQRLKDCQIIEGSLEIHIRTPTAGRNFTKELEDSLSEIVEIEGFLKVVRSTPITSLNFLKNLQVIRGNLLESNKYAVIAWDNVNLQQLFRENQQVQIEKGGLLFHYNPKLCFDKIEKLATGSIMIENYEAAKASNGDRATCNVTRLEVEVKEVFPTTVSIEWKPVKIESRISILSYAIYYNEADETNVDLLDENE